MYIKFALLLSIGTMKRVALILWLLFQNIILDETLALLSKSNDRPLAFVGNIESYARQASAIKSSKRKFPKPSTTRLYQSLSQSPSYEHTLAILTLPQTSRDRIANEAILETCVKHTQQKVSIVLRCQDSNTRPKPKLNDLRGYVGEIYSLVWDSVLGLDKPLSSELLDVIVYPQNLPNAAPEQWLHHRPDLECICSHDSIIGWISASTEGSGSRYQDVEGSGCGGLESHVAAVNVDRTGRGMEKVQSLPVEKWPEVCVNDDQDGMDNNGDIIFLEDEEEDIERSRSTSIDANQSLGGLLGGGYRIPSNSLYNSVAVGGTFDGMHYGHRKLLTLAISSVVPNMGKLLIGITTDEMLQQKTFAELIPPLDERMRGVREFVDALAPGMKNRVKIIPIKDTYGPPGAALDSDVYTGIENDFDALVLSHETLPTGKRLNEHRVQNLELGALKLLCTRRTEVHGMSSTVLRKLRKKRTDEAL